MKYSTTQMGNIIIFFHDSACFDIYVDVKGVCLSFVLLINFCLFWHSLYCFRNKQNKLSCFP